MGLLKSDNVSSRTSWAPAASCRRIFISIKTSAPWRSIAGLFHQSGECSSSLMLQHTVMRHDKQEATPHTAQLQIYWILDFKSLQPLWDSRADWKIYENLGTEARRSGWHHAGAGTFPKKLSSRGGVSSSSPASGTLISMQEFSCLFIYSFWAASGLITREKSADIRDLRGNLFWKTGF